MRTEVNKIAGVTALTEDLRLAGQWIGDCHVTDGATLELLGTITGNLTVDYDAAASIYGTVGGNLQANGHVQIAGTVAGKASGEGLEMLPNGRIGGRA